MRGSSIHWRKTRLFRRLISSIWSPARALDRHYEARRSDEVGCPGRGRRIQRSGQHSRRVHSRGPPVSAFSEPATVSRPSERPRRDPLAQGKIEDPLNAVLLVVGGCTRTDQDDMRHRGVSTQPSKLRPLPAGGSARTARDHIECSQAVGRLDYRPYRQGRQRHIRNQTKPNRPGVSTEAIERPAQDSSTS